jgi:cellulose synthase/poly-beta-1,6-N-acetylglucosamine synthase-like glycosyltransferase
MDLDDQIVLKKRLLDLTQDDVISITISSSSRSSSIQSTESSSVLVDLSEMTDSQEESVIFEGKDYDYTKPFEIQTDRGIIIKKFNDYRPRLNQVYFSSPGGDEVRRGISVIIPFFNEESHELQQTLNSLYDAYFQLRKMSRKWLNEPLYVCLIQDGWFKSSKSMKDYLKYLFPKRIRGKGWWDYFSELNQDTHSNATFIFEREGYVPTSINPQEEFQDKPKFMKITLIIKANNRRKHNSHEWFLGETGFAEATRGKYLFLTDAFTFYSEKCLYYLVKDLDKNKHLSGVTGRQRLMMRDQQGSNESIFSFGCILRMIQLFDFEYANAGYNGAFSLGGLLPVIPGPCGLYRASDILQNKVRNSYFDVVNKEPSETGLIEGNLRIAEDRILTYYAVTKTEEERYLSFNPLAVFYFEAETELQKLMLQRRRWINGSVAGYIYLLFINFNDFKEWNVPILRKIYVWTLLMSQLVIYFMVGFAPGMSMRITYYGIGYFLEYYHVDANVAMILLSCAVWVLYIIHVFIHHKDRFNYLIMIILVLFSLLTSVTLYAALFHTIFIASNVPIIEQLQYANPIVYMAIAVIIFPFIVALSLSGRGHSFMYMLKSFIQYTLFVPLMVAWFGSYAYSRTWDLSWGNRPATELNDIAPEQRDIMVTKFKEKSIYIILILIVCNIAIFFVPLQGQLYFMAVFFVIALYQMILSFIFCLTKINYKLGMVYKNYKKHNDVDM